jgi:hypothetical protein
VEHTLKIKAIVSLMTDNSYSLISFWWKARITLEFISLLHAIAADREVVHRQLK